MKNDSIVSLNMEKRDWLVFLGRSWIIFFLVGQIIFFSVTGTGFFSMRNFQNVLLNSVTILLLATGQTFAIVTGGIDLSVGFVMGFASVVSAKVMESFHVAGYNQDMAIIAGIGIALTLGLFPGLVNGILIAKLKVPPFIATFGMYGIAYGFSELVSYNVPVTNLPAHVGAIGNGYLLYILPGTLVSWFSAPVGLERGEARFLMRIVPNLFIITIIIVAIFAFVLARTRFGQHAYAIGGSVDAARRAGIRVERHLIRVYMMSSFCASLGGVMFVLRFVNGRADAGSAQMLESVVAVVIGGASLYGGKGSLFGTMIGVFIIAVLETGMVNLGIPTFNKYIYVGVILILAVLVDQFFPELVKKGE